MCGQKGISQGDRQGAEFNPVLSGNGSESPNWNDCVCLVSGWGVGVEFGGWGVVLQGPQADSAGRSSRPSWLQVRLNEGVLATWGPESSR